MQIKGVIFDLFHTLTAPESEWSNLPWTSDILGIHRSLWTEMLLSRSRWRLIGDERDPLTIVRTLAHAIDPAIPEERIQEALFCRRERFANALMRIPEENISTLQRLREKDLRLGLISNADVMEVEAWTESPLAGLFDCEVFSCAVHSVKPDAAIFYRCLTELSLAAGECLYVGDGGSDELVGAKDVGMSTVFMSGIIKQVWPGLIPVRMRVADHHIETIPQILEILQFA